MTIIENYDKINFKTGLSLSEYNELVNKLTDITTEYYKNGSFGIIYISQATIIIGSTTDIQLEELTTDELWELVTATDIMQDIAEHLGKIYIQLFEDVDRGVKYRTSLSARADKLTEIIAEAAKLLREQLDNVDINSIVENFSKNIEKT